MPSLSPPAPPHARLVFPEKMRYAGRAFRTALSATGRFFAIARWRWSEEAMPPLTRAVSHEVRLQGHDHPPAGRFSRPEAAGGPCKK